MDTGVVLIIAMFCALLACGAGMLAAAVVFSLIWPGG